MVYKRGYKPISENREARSLSCHIVLNKEKDIVAIVHGFVTRTGYRVDVYDPNALSFQARVASEDPVVALGAAKGSKGAEIDGIRLYRKGVKIDRNDKTVMRPYEARYYLPGFDRLKMMGYNVVKVL